MSLRTPLTTFAITLAIAGMFAYARGGNTDAEVIASPEVSVATTASVPQNSTDTAPVKPQVDPASTTLPAILQPAALSDEAAATLKIATTTLTFSVKESETVIDAMHALASNGKLAFTGRDYPGLGFFVDSINGTKNAGGMNWFLYVNGVSATEGASSAVVNSGDVIEWRYKKSY